MSVSKIPPSEWEKYRQVIRSLYVDRNLSLDALVKEMETAHGFIATKSQYIRKLASWKIGKNATTIAWKKAAVVIEKRKLQGKESEICIDGKLIPCKKMKKEIARHRPPLPEILEMSAHEIDLPGDFLVRTPPATTFHPTQLHRWKIQLHDLPWMKFRDAFMSRSTLFVGSGLGNVPTDLLTNFLVRIPNFTTIATASRTVEYYNRILPIKLSNRVPTTENSLRDGSWTHFILYFVYLVSNNLLERKLIRDTLEWIDSTKNVQVIKALLQFKGPAIEICASALFSGAVYNELASIVQIFLWNGYDPGTSPYHCFLDDGSTMLEIAIRKGNITVTRLLLEFEANPNPTTKRGYTLLQLAIQKGNDAIIRILLENGADPTNALCIASCGSFLASYADSSCDEDIFQLLLEAGASIDGESQGPVILGDDEEHWYFNDVPLVMAAHRHNTQVARFLLRAGANVNQVDTTNGSAIQNAIVNDDMDMVKLLVEAGADVNINKERYRASWAKFLRGLRHVTTMFFSPLQLAAQANNFGMIQYLLQYNADTNDLPALEIIEQDLRSEDYETPLSYAVLGNNLQIATLLLESGANPDAVSLHGHTALGAACRVENVDMIKLLLAYGAAPHYHLGPEFGSSPLQLAILHKDPTLVDDLLQRGADINAPPYFNGGRTALQAAAETGNASLFKRLLDMCGNINAPVVAKKGVTCLQAAMLSGNDEIIEMIVNHGGAATVNSILCAVKIRSLKMVDLLMGLGADVNSPGFAYLGPAQHRLVVTPLVLAIYNQDFDMVHKLLLSGANVSHIDCESGSILPLHQAIRARNLRITKILLSFGADPNQLEPLSGETGLGMATSLHLDYGRYFPLFEGWVNLEWMTPIIRELISHDANVNLMAKGIYPIENVIMSYELMKIFHEAGADIHAPENSLLARAICGGFSTVRLLLDNDANVTGQDKKCGTPLQAAITIGNFDLVSELFARGANVNADPNNLVAYAVELKQPRIVELLLEKNADTNGISPPKKHGCYRVRGRLDSYVGDRTALVAAAEQNNFELVKALIERGANVEADNAPRWATPLQVASFHENLPMVLMLLDRGADVNAKPRGHIRGYNEQPGWFEGWRLGCRTALQAASENRNLQLARLLIERGAKVNMEPYKFGGATALQLAAINGDIQMAALLLEKGANINAAGASGSGRTALEGAAEHGRLDMVYFLLQNDQDETGLEVRCEKAAKYAEREGHLEIAKILREWKGPGSVV